MNGMFGLTLREKIKDKHDDLLLSIRSRGHNGPTLWQQNHRCDAQAVHLRHLVLPEEVDDIFGGGETGHERLLFRTEL